MTAATDGVTRPTMPGVMIAMTDLFVSATATLLVILVLSQTERPVPLPIQADLIAICPSQDGGPFQIMPSGAAVRDADGMINISLDKAIDIRAPGDLSTILLDAAGPPRLFYSIGLAGTIDRPVTTRCLVRMRSGIVAAHNKTVGNAAQTGLAIAGVQLVPDLVWLDSGNE